MQEGLGAGGGSRGGGAGTDAKTMAKADHSLCFAGARDFAQRAASFVVYITPLPSSSASTNA